MKKELIISYMSKDKNFPEGLYAYDKLKNIWFPVVYFRKAKNAKTEIYRVILNYLKALRN